MKEQLVNYWRSLKEQEQQLVMIAGAVFVIFVLVMGIFRPLNNAIEKAEQDNIKQQELLAWVDESIIKLKASGSARVTNDRSLSQIVNSTRNRYQITISKMQPNDNSLRLTIDSVEFNKLVEWLDELVNSQGVLIENLDLSKDDKSGFVRVSRLVLEK
ncbi:MULTISPECIES: type II secretion system protein M [Pseudoalteromonas]|uniref:type II secretion system protein GspM n=1 Tax=Pseudoalteromonas TaxID=53246 RepID=UPI0007829D77|nr:MULTISPECIES: type II secretion system protein M [Gammaproteobacteria]MCF7502177.1 type II secretion system protein M [Pseudoalteromonas sp. L1]RZF95435.1 type II secretion system protein M [Pseudoalteromonas sp. CO302Y]RZG11827.1 type II secretion system protein M [Pseudoalteromonas sp. CO133X]UJX25295.1 type II secretion system protein M [Pseudoalteromonas sp. CF6-2]MCF7520426.1 type II secretion system protein M [Pseudoalteromonas sp. L21]|tara:strand:- start:10460 stop:10933 length:474 start_codon:yes stop_codon:yes gene_type:complete